VIFISVLTIPPILVYAKPCFQAYVSGVKVDHSGLFTMMLLGVSPQRIVRARILAQHSGLPAGKRNAFTTRNIGKHEVAGGNVSKVIWAMIVAYRGGIELGFARAAAIDLAGYDVLEAAKRAVKPTVIECPATGKPDQSGFRGITNDGVELRVWVRLVVRTNLQRLIGGGTEDTLMAQVAGGIVSSIGSAESCQQVLEKPDVITAGLLRRGLATATRYKIVTVNITSIQVGRAVRTQLGQCGEESDGGAIRFDAAELARPAMGQELESVMGREEDEQPDTE